MESLAFRSSSHPLTAAIRRTIGFSVTGLLVAAPTVVLAQDDAEQADTMVVVGTALKVDAPLVETPRPVSTVNREELDERNVQQLDETFRYRAGVLAGHYGSDNDTDWFKVRGFDQSTYQDGLRIYREGFYQWLPEPYGLESVEVFKGPSSILYGEAPPGGLINAISKRPTREKQGRFDIQAGNRDHRQVGIDTSGPLTESGDVRYRLVGTYKERDGDLDHTNNERYYFAPSLAVDITEDTTLTFLASVQKDDGVPTNPFKPAYGTLENTPFGKIDRSANLSQPGYDRNERIQSALGYELEHQFSDTWSFEQNLRYSELDLELRSTYALSMQDERVAGQGHVYRDGTIESWTVDNRLVGNWYTERLENTLLLGVDYQDLQIRGREADNYAFGSIDVFDPQYGTFTPIDESDLIDHRVDKQQAGFYLQNQLRVDDRWVLLGGVRYDQAETEDQNRTSGVTELSDDDQVSLSGGVMYLSENGISPYLSYTESFDPIARVDGSGELYDPREGEQWEAGVKYAPLDWDGYITASVFDLKESNSLLTAPGGYQVQEGERRSKGVELEAIGYLTDNLQLTAAYTYTDTRVDRSFDDRDQRASLTPRHMASTWLDYAFLEGPLSGLTVGAGLRYVGESVDGDVEIPDYTVGDAMVSYDFSNNWRAQVNVNNVTDEEYVASCDFWCYYGESRSVIGSLSYRW